MFVRGVHVEKNTRHKFLESIKGMNECMNEWMNQPTEWKHEWMNEYNVIHWYWYQCNYLNAYGIITSYHSTSHHIDYTLTASTPHLDSSAACVSRIGSMQSAMNSLTCCGALPTNREGSRRVSRVLCTAENRLSDAIRESKSLSAPSSFT